MAFNASLEMAGMIAKITLSGELDASVAPQFREKVEEAARVKAARLVLLLQELEYMSSAGLRALIFAKQKMGSAVDIYMVGAQPDIIETLEMTGFVHGVILLPEYDAAKIEAL
jgi:anti-anti-sigma factor